MPANLVNNRERLRRFEQEAQVASALNHPNIITIHEIGLEGDTHFIAIEFIEGETLRGRLQATRLEIKETLSIATQIATALDAAHRSGIVHRDIKPENVMVREDGLVKVLDFGLATLAEKKREDVDGEAATRAQVNTEAGMILGTVAYMSPEQARGLVVDARTDIFSFGVALYEMLTGRFPFTGDSTSDVLASILRTEPQPPGNFSQDIPPELNRIVAKTLEKDREERYQTAKDLLVDLKHLKKQIEVQTEIDRTTSANEQIDKETKQNLAARPTSNVGYAASEIKKHKRFVAVLSVLMLAAIGFGYWFFVNRSATATPIESIAVMPFVNESGNADVEYLSDGMTESLITSLSQLPNLLVKARGSVFSYKGRDVKPQQIGSELSVQAILNGRFVLRGDDVTLYLSLVDARNGNQLWGEHYNRKLTDLVALQQEIARDVSQKLRAQLSSADEQKLAKNYTANAEAYQLYLKGRFFWNKRTREGFEKAIEYFNQAIDSDPGFALAYAGLGDTYGLMGQRSMLPSHDAYPKASAAVSRALEIDETLAEAHVSLALVKGQYYFDWPGAEREYKRALELNPGYAYTYGWSGMHLVQQARFDEAFPVLKRAEEIDPLSPSTAVYLAWYYYYARRYDQAIVQGGKALEIDPNFRTAHSIIGSSYEQKGMSDEAVAHYLRAFDPDMIETLKEAYAASGIRGFWRRRLELLSEASRKRYVSACVIAEVHATLGEKEQALPWLQKAYEERAGEVTFIKVNPRFDGLRSDPRFQDLLRGVGLPP